MVSGSTDYFDMSDEISLLVVTREGAEDRRFGLGKSLYPVLEQLDLRGVRYLYLSQEHAGARSSMFLLKVQKWLVTLLRPFFPDTEIGALSGGILQRINMGRLAAKVAYHQGFTHVHCHDPIIAAGFQWFRYWYGLFRHSRVKHGLTQHGFGSYTQAIHEDGALMGTAAMTWMRWWERRILRRAGWVVIPTEAGKRQLARDLSEYPIPDHWHVIPHPRPALGMPDRLSARKQLGWGGDQFVVLGVGRNASLKRFDRLIQACAALGDKDLHLILIGPGEDGGLRRIAERHGLPEKQLHLTVCDDPSLFYAAADLYVSTSETESFGMANLEAMMAGLPVLATAVGGVPEVLGNGAWLLSPSDPKALTEAIDALRNDQDLRLNLVWRARMRAARWPDSSAIAAEYLSLYKTGQLTSANNKQQKFQARGVPGAKKSLSLYPLPAYLSLHKKLRVLVLAPHPDDETLGVGGTLAALSAIGSNTKVVAVTDGGGGDPEHKFQGPAAKIRRREFRKALSVLGVKSFEQWNFVDGQCVNNEALRIRIQSEIHAFKPDWLMVPAPLDIHRDHVAVSLATIAAWARAGGECRLFFYEVTQPLPVTHLVDISSWKALKMKAINVYRLPLSYCDYSAIAEGLISYRKGVCASSDTAVEAFMELTPGEIQPTVAALMTLRKRIEAA